MNYIIDGYIIPTEYDLCRDGALFYVPSTLPASTMKKLKSKLHADHDVVRIMKVQHLETKYYGDDFQRAHDDCLEKIRSLDLKFEIKGS